MLLYFILPSQKVTLLLIPYYFTIPLASQNSIFIKILFFSSFFIISFQPSLFFRLWHVSIFLGFPTVFFFLSLPQPLASVQHTEPHTQTHDTPINLSKPITTHTEPHTHTHKHKHKSSNPRRSETHAIKPSNQQSHRSETHAADLKPTGANPFKKNHHWSHHRSYR